MIGPLVLTGLIVCWGARGWILLGGLFVVAASGDAAGGAMARPSTRWPADPELPAGRRAEGFEGTLQECAARVEEVWTDMCPAGLRRRMDAAVG
ncbi:hypothetical protein [Streptomyces sp. NPDC059991]|uniref:hypothetical protein n=1 Tax=unclassified Streptomyces TaxID=2593676 RepID=UPI0036806D04